MIPRRAGRNPVLFAVCRRWMIMHVIDVDVQIGSVEAGYHLQRDECVVRSAGVDEVSWGFV
jgi:hypothetical protein